MPEHCYHCGEPLPDEGGEVVFHYEDGSTMRKTWLELEEEHGTLPESLKETGPVTFFDDYND